MEFPVYIVYESGACWGETNGRATLADEGRLGMSNNEVFWLKDSPPVGPVLQTQYRTSKLTLARFSSTKHSEFECLKAEDAVVAMIQISDMPAHDYFMDGKAGVASAGPSSAFNFADMRMEPGCRTYGHLDNFHLHIPRAALDDLADDADSPPIERLYTSDGWETSDPILDAIKQTLIGASLRPEESSQLFVDHMMIALHAHLARTYGGMREAQRRRSGGLAPWQERLAKELIAADLTQDHSLVKIADECRLSMAHFARAFKVSTGCTPHAWLQERRVDKARELMATGLSLAEVALACGFADQSHFTRIFTRVVGDTPGAWRRFRIAA